MNNSIFINPLTEAEAMAEMRLIRQEMVANREMLELRLASIEQRLTRVLP